MDYDCDDEALIDDAQEGNPRAFQRLVECNQDKLINSMFRFLRCQEDAEEAVQEAFMRAFSRLDTFKRDSKFSTWLYRIAFNSAITSRRQRRPGISLDQRVEEHGIEVVDQDTQDVDVGLIREDRMQLIHRALDKLSDEHRAILVLREMDEMAYEEIADILNISIGTVRSRLSRARGRLREVIAALQASVAEV